MDERTHDYKVYKKLYYYNINGEKIIYELVTFRFQIYGVRKKFK